MPVTQKQIAERLNISRSWVARALNDYDSVSPEMRARVHAVAQEMGYDMRTNQAARSLISKRYGLRVKHGIIAVAFPPTYTSPQQMPFYAPFFVGMESAASAHGLDIIIMLYSRTGELPRLIREGSVDGVVTVGFLEHEVTEIRELGLPVVTYQATYKNAHSMMVDDREGTRLVTRHLLELGHRNIAYLGVEQQWDIQLATKLRQQGYEDALAEYGIPVRHEWIDTSLPIPDTSSHKYCTGCGRCAACIGWQTLKTKAQIKQGEKTPYTAVVCHHDVVAMGVIDQARADGLQTPTDLSVVGFDDISNQYHFEPHVTSVSFSREEMGRGAVQLINESAVAGEESEPYTHQIFPVKLVVRESTGKMCSAVVLLKVTIFAWLTLPIKNLRR